MAASMPSESIPIMTGGVAQSPVIYQQPMVIGAAQTGQLQYNNRRNQNEEHCKIFVGGVGKNTTDESLRSYFKKFGEISDSVIMNDRETGEPRGFAFVTFKQQDAVQAVIEQCNKGGHILDGKVIDPKPAVPQGPNQQERVATFKAQAATQAAGNTYKPPMHVSEDLKIFVGGIGIGTTEEDVKQYFSTFGPVVAVDMPYHKIYNCPKGFAFVGFENAETVNLVTKDRYHQINGKTVEVKGAEEQKSHLRKKREEGQHSRNRYNAALAKAQATHGSIGTVAGLGAYAQMAAGQQVLIPQVGPNGQTTYTAVQIPPTAGGGYVYDPSSNVYYQLGGSMIAGAAPIGAAPNFPYAGVQIMAAPGAAGQVVAAPRVQGDAAMIAGLGGADGHIGSVYPNETSTFGPSRSHVHGGGHQPIAGTTDPQVVYSNATALSAGESVSSRGYHPYGR